MKSRQGRVWTTALVTGIPLFLILVVAVIFATRTTFSEENSGDKIAQDSSPAQESLKPVVKPEKEWKTQLTEEKLRVLSILLNQVKLLVLNLIYMTVFS